MATVNSFLNTKPKESSILIKLYRCFLKFIYLIILIEYYIYSKKSTYNYVYILEIIPFLWFVARGRRFFLEKDKKVICPYCNKEFKRITSNHLVKHGVTLEEYQKIYQPITYLENIIIDFFLYKCINIFYSKIMVNFLFEDSPIISNGLAKPTTANRLQSSSTMPNSPAI